MKDIFSAPFIREMGKTASNMYRLGWDERNGGNISYRLREEEVGEYLDLGKVIREIPIGFDAPSLAGEIFVVTGTGKYFKNVEDDPETNLGVIRIKKDGIPQINSSLSSDNNAVSSRWLTSADYLVVKNLTLAYLLPQTWVKPMGLQSVGVNVSCENLWTFAARQGMNPQQSFAGGQANYLVTPRIFSVGVSVKL